MYDFQTESKLHSCLNIKELLARNRCYIWSLNDRNRIWPHNYLVRKWTLNHLAKLAKWLSCVVSNYQYSAFDCMLSSCQICTLYLPECQGSPCLKQAWYWKFDSNRIRIHNHLVHKQILNHLAKLAKWLSFVVSTYLYCTFGCRLLSCHVRVSSVSHIEHESKKFFLPNWLF